SSAGAAEPDPVVPLVVASVVAASFLPPPQPAAASSRTAAASARIGPVRLRLDIEYDGTGFSGWAAQPGFRTVEGTLREALGKLYRAHDNLSVAGRTDAGAHALGQVASVDVKGGPPPEHVAEALNTVLAHDLAVTAAAARRCLARAVRPPGREPAPPAPALPALPRASGGGGAGGPPDPTTARGSATPPARRPPTPPP